MTFDDTLRRLKGILGQALVWGAGWAALGFLLYLVLWVAGVLPETMAWYDGLMVAIRFGVVGVAAGAVFAGAVWLVYNGRRLSELSSVRFGIGGAVLAALFLPVFLQLMNLISGDGLVAWQHVLDDSLWASLFGGAAAGGTLEIAQRADRALPAGDVEGAERLEEGAGRLPADGGRATR